MLYTAAWILMFFGVAYPALMNAGAVSAQQAAVLADGKEQPGVCARTRQLGEIKSEQARARGHIHLRLARLSRSRRRSRQRLLPLPVPTIVTCQ